ncbi:hypothetical protein COCOBI_05-6220 [Coccomyxa sp. Obi]|nr:hypothetical protein COCOBI_05-6220 [Coccomyxa sp. Obi]
MMCKIFFWLLFKGSVAYLQEAATISIASTLCGSACCVLQTSGQECTDPTNPAVGRLYNRECTADTVTIRTALPLTVRSGDTYGKNLVVYGKEVTLAANLTNAGREVTVIAETIRCGGQATTISTVPAAPDSSQSLENLMTWDGTCPSGSQSQIFCGKNGRSATYVTPRGGNIKLAAASLLCDNLNLIADGGKGAAGQDGQKGSPCEPAKAGRDGCDTLQKCDKPKRNRAAYYLGEDAVPGKAGGNGGTGGSGTLPGSGGNILARFVNQTAGVDAKASIGVFPRRSSGGAAGGAGLNCQGALGGKGATRTGLLSPQGIGTCQNIIPYCNGKAAPAPSTGNSGLSGPDPQGLPGVANLTKGTITLDQLPSVDSLLPFYDQVQLDMILGEGNARYVAKDYTGAGDVFTFLTTLTGPCLTGTAGPSNCNSTFAQAGTSLQQMQQGFSFYGRPSNWVPLISAQTINDVIKPLLSALQTVEAVYVKGYLDKAKDKITKLELQDYISKSVATTNSYDNQIGTLQKQYDDTVTTFNELAVQRSAAATTLQRAGEKFQQEILSKLRLDAFLDGLQAIASIATASVPNLLQIGDIYKKVTESKAPAAFKDNYEVAGGGVVACSVLSGFLKDGVSGYKNVKQDLYQLDQADAFKNFVDNDEFENFIQSFKTLPGYKVYGKALKDYKNVCLAASAKVLSASGIANQISSLRGQVDNLRLSASQANERLARSVNPADALYSSFFEAAYDNLITNIRSYLYQAYQALTYTSLAVSSPADDNKISDYAGLTAAFAAYQDAAVQALAKAGGEKQQFKTPNEDTTFLVTRDNALNWDEGLRTGRLQFLIPTSTPNFMKSRGLVTIDSVDIRYNGARQKTFFGRNLLYTTIEHEGTPIVKARNCTDYQFVHDRTIVLHVYDTYYGTTTQPATFNRGDIYIKLSPYTAWTLDFSQSFNDIDFSGVTSISLAFTGEFAALDLRTCIGVRTQGEGILLVPELSESEDELQAESQVESPAAANTTSFAAVGAVSTASSIGADSLANLAEDFCPAVDFTVEVNPIAAATDNYYFGGILLDNGGLPFELPKYEGEVQIYAVPLEFPLNCSARIHLPTPIADHLLLGSVPLEAVARSSTYAANFTITSEMGLNLKWKLPTLAGGYHLIFNVTSTSGADLYDDNIDTCFTYKCSLF